MYRLFLFLKIYVYYLGTGPADYTITGGVGVFFGAFGKIKGDIIQGTFVGTGVPLAYNAEIEVCYPTFFNADY